MANTTVQVLAFWNEVHTAFPSERLYQWMDLVAEGRGDWFRNLSLTRVAMSENSVNSQGKFSPYLYSQNELKLETIIQKHIEVIRLMQE